MDYLFSIGTNLIEGFLLATFFVSFLTLLSKGRLMFFAFGSLSALVFFLTDFLHYQLVFSFWAGSAFTVGIYGVMIGRTVLLMLAVFGLSWLFFQKEIGKQIFLVISFFAVLDISDLICWSLGDQIMMWGVRLFETVVKPEMTEGYLHVMGRVLSFLEQVFYAVFIFAAIRSIRKVFVYKQQPLNHWSLFTLILPCLTGLAVTQAVQLFLIDANGYTRSNLDERPISWIFIFLLALFFLLILITSIHSFQKTIHLYLEEKNQTVLKEQIKFLQKQDITGMYAEMRGMRHDMKNHLANIRLLARADLAGDQTAAGELVSYLGKMEERMEEFDFVFQTGNSVSDILIHQKYLEAKQKHIRFTSHFIYPAQFGLQPYDLAVILNNALENACEACMTVAEPHRFIRIHALMKGRVFFVRVENSYAGLISFDGETGLPVTDKPDSAFHGLGLANIRRCAEKYYGGIDIRLLETEGVKTFRLTVMLSGNG